VFCQKVGHHVGFCPSKPTTPRQNIPFVESLLVTPKIKLQELEGLTWEETFDLVCKRGRELNKGNPWLGDPRPFSSLRKNLGFWKSIGADRTVLSWIAYGVQFRFEKEPRRKFFENPSSVWQYEEFIDKEVNTHLSDGSFVEEKVENVRIINPFLISVNSNGKPRRCDDLRFVNGYLSSPMFKMQSLGGDVPNVVHNGDKLFTRDLEKAYYKIPIEESSTQYQCFYWKGKYYRSLVLLFGLCQAPFVFTKICRTIVRFFGALMIRLVNFVDDFLFCENPAKLIQLQKFVDKIFHMCGWTLSEKDNQIGTRVKFLGFVIDSETRRFAIPEKVRDKVLKLIETTCVAIREGRVLSVQDIRRVTGKLISLKLTIPTVPIWLRDLYFYLPSEPSDDENKPCIHVGIETVHGLRVIKSMIASSGESPFVSPVSERDVFVDSGEIGWGASILGLETHGLFDDQTIGQSSTFRELIGLREFLKDPLAGFMIGKVVRINMDSRCAIANLFHAGPVRILLPLVKDIWNILGENNITPIFRWVSRENRDLRRVDELSKCVNFSLTDEWKERLEDEFQLPVVVVDHNKIPEVLGWLVSRKCHCLFFTPRWEGKSWWTLLCHHARRIIRLNKQCVRFNRVGSPGWEFIVAEL